MSPRSDSPSRPLFFLHIPKTAGTSLRDWLGNHFAASRVRWVDYRDPDGVPVGSLDDYDLVAGHACYGFVKRFTRPPRVITFLRDPVERALSAFYFLRQVGWERLRRQGEGGGALRACELDLAEFLARQPREARMHLGNTQTWMLARDRLFGSYEAAITMTRDDLRAARTNLARCDLVGLTERTGEAVASLCGLLGWPAADSVGLLNRTEGRPSRADLDPSTRQALEALTDLDRELYDFAADLFERRPGPAPVVRPPWGPPGGPRPESACLSFDEPIPGQGWLGREAAGRRHHCWLEREAWVDLWVAVRGDMRVRCTALAVVAERQLSQVTLAVNGVPLATSVQRVRGGLVFEAAVHRAVLRQSGDGPVRVAVSVAEPLRPCDEIRGSADTRRLGLAVQRIELLPAAAAARNAA